MSTPGKPNLATVPAFRKAALEHHANGKREGTLPEFLSHRFLGPMWLVALATAVGMALAWGQKVPHLVTGSGRLVDAHGALVIALYDGDVRAGQSLTCTFAAGQRLVGRVERVSDVVYARLEGAAGHTGSCQAVIRAGTRRLLHLLSVADLFAGVEP